MLSHKLLGCSVHLKTKKEVKIKINKEEMHSVLISLSKSCREKQQKVQRAVRLNKRHLYSPPLTSALSETNQSERKDRLIDRRDVLIESYSCLAARICNRTDSRQRCPAY